MSTRELDRLLEDAVNQLKSSGVPTDARSGRVKDSAMDVVEEYILDKYGDNNSKGFKDGLLSAFKPIVRKHSVKLVAELLEQKQTNREWKMEGTQFSDRAREWTLSTAKAAMKKYEEVTKAGADADADADDGPDALAVTVLVKSVRTIVLLLLHASKAVANKSSALARNTEKLFASDRPVAIFRFALLDLEYTVTYAQLLNTLKKSVVETDVRVTPSGKVYCPVKCCVNSQGRKKFSSLKAIRTHFESRSCAAYAVLEKHHYYLETRPAKPRNKGGKEVGLKRDRNSVSGLARANQTSMKRHVVASPRGQPAKRQKTNGGEARPSHSRRAVSVSSSDSEESSDAQSSSGDGGHPASPARQEGSGRRTMTDAERRILYDEIQPADEV